MSKSKRTAAQAAKDRAALKRLAKSDTYRGKVDLRKAPTPYQLKKIAELKKARKPLAPSKKSPTKSPRGSQKRPRQPLPPKQQVPGATIKRSRMSEREVRDLKPHGDLKLITYALPFLRKGQEKPEWRRFTRAQLTKFINEYKADDPEGGAEWKSYAVREEWHFHTKTERTEFKRETDLYFSGVRISEPQGGVTQKRGPNKKGHRGKRGRK